MTQPIPEVVTLDGEEFWQWRVVLRIPKNWTPESGVFIAVAPPGGIANFPAAIQGRNGLSPALRNIVVEELEHDDPTPASARWELVAPATDTIGPVYDEYRTQHRGRPGLSATTALLGASDLTGTPLSGYVFQVNAAGDGAELVAMKVGNMYWPTTITTLSNANGANTIASVVIPTQPWGYRLAAEGQQTLDPDGPDVQVDLVARLGGTGTGTGATDGSVIARGYGLAGGTVQNLVLSPAPPVGSSAGFGEVANGASRTVYIRCEQIGSGVDTFDTVAGRGLFSVRVEPLQ